MMNSSCRNYVVSDGTGSSCASRVTEPALASRVRFTRLLLIGAGAALFAATVYRAVTYPFTHDEALTYAGFTSEPFWAGDANNHLLNTWLMRVCAMAFGTSELSLRLPNLLAFLLYLVCAMLLLERIDSTLTRVAGFVLLAMNPFVLDFFALARGYGLAMAFLLASLWLLLRGSLRSSLAAGALAVLASLAFLNAFIPIAAVVLWLLVRQNRVREAWFAGAACAAFLLVIGLEVLRLADGGRLYFGGERGFIEDTLFSLVRATLYVRSSSEGVLAFLVIATFFALAFRRTPMFVILCGAVLLTLLEHSLAGTRFPVERVALYYIPLFALALIFAIRGKSGIAVSAVIVFLGVWHFARTFDVHTNRTWPYDAHNKEILEKINRERGGRKVRAGVSWQFEPSLNFYRVTRNYTWLAPLTRHPIDGTEDYVYGFAPDVPRGPWLVLARYPDTGTIFVRPKRVGGERKE